MDNHDTVSSIEEMKALDDTTSEHMRPCLVEGHSWFLLDRLCTGTPDDKSRVACKSGKGCWVVMEPKHSHLVSFAAHT